MPRTTIQVEYDLTHQEASKRIESILSMRGFKPIDYNGESVWKKGIGALTAMQYIKIEYSLGGAAISAWVQAGLGSIGGSEMDLTGFIAGMPKKMLLNLLEEIQHAL